MDLLQIDGVAAGYGNKAVLSDLTLALRPGEVLALLGHNGAGKTTALRTIAGLLPARRGTVTLAGTRVEAMSVAQRQALGLRLLPEGRGIFPDLSVAENLDVVAAANCRGAGDLFGMADVFGLFPVLQERRGVRAGSMSGGQQQMLALSLAILGTPRCLMMDEPSIGLAPNIVARIFELVRDLCVKHAMGVLLVEQNVAAAMKIADRIVIMNNGEIVFAGRPDEARAANVWHYF
ncbi:ABC transporter ATP-binding protein [Acidisphaera sp. L21]|uniref:ABC transporter ATP-binding protein n=1 Tax=Acidisphaera sp. L21 TaxID=1641851 RepID=UPI00131DF415|nr:ABC transporter ATP-binding protein [Acidisphaera sp. L21]